MEPKATPVHNWFQSAIVGKHDFTGAKCADEGMRVLKRTVATTCVAYMPNKYLADESLILAKERSQPTILDADWFLQYLASRSFESRYSPSVWIVFATVPEAPKRKRRPNRLIETESEKLAHGFGA